MKFLSLEVHHFRAVEHAALELGPGLNVLYGPNDLGKTTLIRALRAALLLPSDSTAHKELVSWHSPERPEVSVVFSVPPTQEFRLRKVFGAGSDASSELYAVSGGAEPRLEQRGRGVDRRLRELLGWGIESPGGRGGSRGLPESFLSQALLGEQAAPVALLGRGLGTDRDDSGRLALQEALATLGQDPVFQGVLERADEQVRIAFTPTGRRRGGRDSPFFGFRERILSLTEQAQQLAAQRRETEEVQRALASLAERRAELDALLHSRRQAQHAMQADLQRLEVRLQAEQALTAARQSWQRYQAAEAALQVLQGELQAAERTRAAAEQTHRGAEARLAACQKALAEAEAERQGQGSRRAELKQRHAEAERERTQLEAHWERLEALQRLAAELREAEEATLVAQAERSAAQAALRSALAAQRQAEQELARQRKLLLAAQWTQASGELRAAQSAARQRAEDQRKLHRLESELAGLNAALEASAGLPEAHQELSDSSAELRLAQARLDLGLELRLVPPPGGFGGALRVQVDDGQPATVANEPVLEVSARSQVEAQLASGLVVTAQAGSKEQRARVSELVRQLQERRSRTFARWGVGSESELVQRLEERQRQAVQAEDTSRTCESLRQRLGATSEATADIEKLAQQVALWERELGDDEAQRQSLLQQVEGSDRWARERAVQSAERELGERQRAASKAEQYEAERRVHLLSAQQRRDRAHAALQQSGTRGQSEAAEDRSVAAIQERMESLRSQSEGLRQRVAELARELGCVGAELDEAVERCSAQLSAFQAQVKASEAALQQARDGAIALQTSYDERRRALDEAEGSRLRADYERAQARLRELPEVEPNLSDRAAALDAEIEKLEQQLALVQGELARTEGRLTQVGGDVVLERERSVQQALLQTERRQSELELDYDAYQLLSQVLRKVESEQGAHLGRALADPLSQRFSQLTSGRYRALAIDQDLAFSGVHVAGEERPSRELSEGTQEQLVALLRLCVAEHLRQAIVLDDHLVQTHCERARWFREFLREIAQKVQVIVVTARPEDYVDPEEMPPAPAPFRDTASGGAALRVVDLERIIQRR